MNETFGTGEGSRGPFQSEEVSNTASPARVTAIACWKLVELRAGVDPLTGAVVGDPLSAGASAADEAALEWALRVGEASGGAVAVVTAGGPRADDMLRRGLAAGAGRAARVPLAGDEPSQVVAAALASAVRALAPYVSAAEGSAGLVVCCGDASLDRGSGSVPAYLAAELGVAQALGLVGLTVPPPFDPGATDPPRIEGVRRLDGGQRERLALRPPCVLSVEAGTARLRRAPLGRALAGGAEEVEELPSTPWAEHPVVSVGSPELVALAPFRPRARLVPPPPEGLSARERIDFLVGLAGNGLARQATRRLVLGPEEAAEELLSTLAGWGELPEGLGAALGIGQLPRRDASTSDETEPP